MKKFAALLVMLSFTAMAYADVKTVAEADVKPVTEEEAIDLVRINKTMLPMKSKLKKRYSAYQIVVTSDYPGTLQLTNANINNGFPGAAAYTQVETSKAHMWWGALLGLGGIIVVGLPILGVISASNSKAEKESVQFSNQVPVRELHKGESFNFTALTLVGQQPDINLALKDKATGLEFSKR